MLPVIGVFGWVSGKAYPYYRFINPKRHARGLRPLGDRVGTRRLARRFRWNVQALTAVASASLAIAGFLYLKPGYRAWSKSVDSTIRRSWRSRARARNAHALPGTPVVFVISPSPASPMAGAW